MTALDADDVQRSRHLARQMTEHAEIMYEALLKTTLPPSLVENMLLTWWTELWKPRMPDLPDFTKLFDTGDD